MHENSGNSVIFYSFYTQDGAGDTGLTVTVDVYEVIRDGTATLIVDDGAVTEIGGGLYRYLLASASVDAAAEYIAIFHTADTDTDQKDIPAMWVIDRSGLEKLDSGVTLAPDSITASAFDESTAFPIKSADTGATTLARTGADSDTLETLSDQIDGVGGGAGGTSKTYTVTDADTGLPIADVHVWVSTDTAGANVVASGHTDVSGQVTFMLDSGTYYLWRMKSGYNFTNPDTEVVA